MTMIERMLSEDFHALTKRLAGDAFVERMITRLKGAERRRFIAIGFAGAAGAAVASSQFGAIAAAIRDATPAVATLPIMENAAALDLGAAPILATALLFALVGGATALIVPGWR